MDALGNLVSWPLTAAGSRTVPALGAGACAHPLRLAHGFCVWVGPSVLGVLLPRHWPTQSTSGSLVYGGCLKVVGSLCVKIGIASLHLFVLSMRSSGCHLMSSCAISTMFA